MLELKFVLVTIIIECLIVMTVCLAVTICAYLKTSKRKEIVFKNSGYEKRIKKLEEDIEQIKKNGKS